MQISKMIKRVVAVAAVVAAGSVAAAPISVGFNFSPISNVLSGNGANGDITTSTEVTSSSGLYVVTDIDLLNTTNNIDLQGPVGLSNGAQIFLTNPMPLTLGGLFTKEFTANGILFTESLTVTNVSTGSGNRSILATGTISCGAGCGFDDTAVYFSASYTQNGGPTSQIGAIFNNSTVPPAAVPEPGSMALVGLALAGLGLTARRRAAK